MQPSQQNNKRIAKNTLMLYLRMIIVTLISLVTVKYTLKILGVEDYGIYNVIGGVVSFLTIVTGTMTSATQRFLAYDLGRNNHTAYSNTFNMLLLVFLIMGILIFLFFELFGYPIIYKWLAIPNERLNEAYVVYHLSALAFVANVITIPFISSIIANEKMNVYAYITIFDSIGKLAILGLLIISPSDKLITYSAATLLMVLLVNGVYVWYNQKKINLTPIFYYWDKSQLRKITKYTGWSLFGSVSGVMCTQGLSIVMNLFFGVTVNAAKAISDKIKNIVYSFVQNFYVAVSPQIIKSYAAGDYYYTLQLAFRSTKLSYYLLFLITVPVMAMLDNILHSWLGETCTPDMVIFTQLSLIFALVNVFETPITYMIRATGQVKFYQITVGIITLMVVPLAYLLFYLGLPAYMGFVAEIIIYSIAQIARIHVAKNYYEFSYKDYFIQAMLHPLLMTIVIIAIGLCFAAFNINAYINSLLLFIIILIWIWCIGLDKKEKSFVKKIIINKIQKK